MLLVLRLLSECYWLAFSQPKATFESESQLLPLKMGRFDHLRYWPLFTFPQIKNKQATCASCWQLNSWYNCNQEWLLWHTSIGLSGNILGNGAFWLRKLLLEKNMNITHKDRQVDGQPAKSSSGTEDNQLNICRLKQHSMRGSVSMRKRSKNSFIFLCLLSCKCVCLFCLSYLISLTVRHFCLTTSHMWWGPLA